MWISVVGAGYVGLVTAACLAHLGNNVRVLEIDRGRVAELRKGMLPFREPNLDELVAEGLATSRLTFDDDPDSIHGTRLAIIAVGTLDNRGEWTDRTVRSAVLAIAADSRAPRSIVIRSSLMPGTAAAIAAATRLVATDVEIASNPEFTREASAVNDFLVPDRIVIGVTKQDVASSLVDDLSLLYSPLEAPIHVTDLTSAEMIKIGSNVFLAAKITFANELARLCAALGGDIAAVVDGMGLDHRIGRSFLSPGPGYGGSCFPSQARALPTSALQYGVHMPMISAIAPSNEHQADWVLDGLQLALEGSLRGRNIALLGLTFKAGTDDLRESPALSIARRLAKRGALVTVFDPMATGPAVNELKSAGIRVAGATSAEDACRGTSAVVVATEWPEFRLLDWVSIRSTMVGRVIVDVRRIVDVDAARDAGLDVVAFGVSDRAWSGAAA